jgi:hypothetical protein
VATECKYLHEDAYKGAKHVFKIKILTRIVVTNPLISNPKMFPLVDWKKGGHMNSINIFQKTL